MITPGDVPRFPGGIHNPQAQLTDLANRVGMLEGVRYLPPLEVQGSPAGALVSLREQVGTGTLFVQFTLATALATTDASQSGCTVNYFFGGANPGSTVKLYNLPASTGYIFSGAAGAKGLAVKDATGNKFWIVQLECPGGAPATVGTVCCGSVQVPKTLHANITSTCPCFNGAAFLLTWQSGTRWTAGPIAGLDNACYATSNGTGLIQFAATVECKDQGAGAGWLWYGGLSWNQITNVTPPGVATKLCAVAAGVVERNAFSTGSKCSPVQLFFDCGISVFGGVPGCDCNGQTLTIAVT